MCTVSGPDSAQIRLVDVTRIFHMGEVQVAALLHADLVIHAGDFVVILGPSGSGKSTLLNIVGGVDRPSSGQVWYDNTNLTLMSEEALTAYRRRHIGFIFQFYNLVPSLTALENVQVATELVEEPLEAARALALVGLEQRRQHFPAQLSGGEQQRVAIARALAKKPGLLLADEPTGALDLEMARNVLGLLQDLNRERGLTVILITHNPAIATIASRVIRLASGRITETRENPRPAPAHEVTW